MSYIKEILGFSYNIQYKIVYSLILLIVLWLIKKIFSRVIIERFESNNQKYQWNKSLRYTAGFTSIILLVSIWVGGLASLGTYLGLLSAGIAIALKDPLVNFSGWFFIIIRKPFKVGDRIQIENMIGDVIDIRIFQFSVIEIGNWVDAEQSTGRIIHVPNGILFTQRQANYTLGFEYIWNEIPVLVTFESDWQKAKKILTEIVEKNAIHLSKKAEEQIKKTASSFLIYYEKLTPIVYTTVKDSGVLLTMRYLCHTRMRRGSEQAIWENILIEFAKHNNIDFAYPTQRFYHNNIEGKHGTKPDNTLEK